MVLVVPEPLDELVDLLVPELNLVITRGTRAAFGPPWISGKKAQSIAIAKKRVERSRVRICKTRAILSRVRVFGGQ